MARLYPWFVPHPVYDINVQRGAHRTLTDQRLGAMAALLTRFAVGFSLERTGQAAADGVNSPSGNAALKNGRGPSTDSAGGSEPNAASSTMFTTNSSIDNISPDYRTIVAATEKHALYVRSSLAWAWFVVFWLVSWATV